MKSKSLIYWNNLKNIMSKIENGFKFLKKSIKYYKIAFINTIHKKYIFKYAF